MESSREYTNKKRIYEFRKELGINEEAIVILFMGKLIEKKRPLDLLKAYEFLNSKFHILNSSLLFVGDGVLRLELEKYVKDNNLKNVYFAGFKNQTELPKYYTLADVLVLPSGREKLGAWLSMRRCVLACRL